MQRIGEVRTGSVPPFYVGIDPGANGGVAVLRGSDEWAGKLPETPGDLWEWLNRYSSAPIFRESGIPDPTAVYAVIEQQTPRPTNIFDRITGQWRATILASTCLLYGAFTELRMALYAAGIVFEECPPKRWQKALNISPRERGAKDSEWKNKLKAKAQQLFPRLKVTLATADALLIAEYCRRSREGKLTSMVE